MLLGIGITGKSDLPGNPVVSVEYHRCDRCSCEFRLYYKSKSDLTEAIEQIGKKLGNNWGEDLCFNCQMPVPVGQLAMPFDLK